MTAVAEPCADGIEYLAWVPSKRHFRCEKLSATMSTDDCATRWRTARAKAADARYSGCLRCPIGSIHAGEGDPLLAMGGLTGDRKRRVVASPDEGNRCTRCGRGGLRLVGPTRCCVSCWNRHREWKIGRNAKGKAPETYRPLVPRRIGILVDGLPAFMMVQDTQRNAEPLARAIRSRGAVTFHEEQPGDAHWNVEAQRWEYRDWSDPSRVLLEFEDGGLTFYLSAAADSLRPGEIPATVRAPTTLMTAGEASEWLEATRERGDGADVGPDWKPLDIICDSCGVAQLQARSAAGRVDCRCPACEDTTAVPRSAVVGVRAVPVYR